MSNVLWVIKQPDRQDKFLFPKQSRKNTDQQRATIQTGWRPPFQLHQKTLKLPPAQKNPGSLRRNWPLDEKQPGDPSSFYRHIKPGQTSDGFNRNSTGNESATGCSWAVFRTSVWLPDGIKHQIRSHSSNLLLNKLPLHPTKRQICTKNKYNTNVETSWVTSFFLKFEQKRVYFSNDALFQGNTHTKHILQKTQVLKDFSKNLSIPVASPGRAGRSPQKHGSHRHRSVGSKRTPPDSQPELLEKIMVNYVNKELFCKVKERT